MTTRRRTRTLWDGPGRADQALLDYTAGDDRIWDARLITWDIVGSLGHVQGLAASGLITPAQRRRLVAALRAALRDAESGRLRILPEHEDAHSAVELQLTERIGALGQRLHTGRSRNDQIACDLRLLMKAQLLAAARSTHALVTALLVFARRHERVVWPGYTHQRLAMPSTAGAWAAALAEGLIDTLETLPSVWAEADRCPLGSAAGYGVPLPLDRERTARALGFGALDQVVTKVQNGRGKVEAAALFWCVQLGHELAKLSTDVILWSGAEFGLLTLPAELSTGSSIMPHKRNPDVFELTRARAAALDADLGAVLAIRAKLGSGYHRDFQELKAPLMRGLERAQSLTAMLAASVPRLGVNAERGRALVGEDALATDEVMRRVAGGTAFRRAYDEVKAALAAGEHFGHLSARELIRRRRSTGGLGNLGLGVLTARARTAAAWERRARAAFGGALGRLVGVRTWPEINS